MSISIIDSYIIQNNFGINLDNPLSYYINRTVKNITRLITFLCKYYPYS